MIDRQQLLFVALVIAVGLASPSPRILSQELSREGSKAYSSPRAVFNAYRDAGKRRDWHAMFSCMTADFKDSQAFDAFFCCSMRSSTSEVRAIYAHFGVRPDAIQTEYYKQYKAKHGGGIPKPLPDRKGAEPTETHSQTPKAGMSIASGAVAATTGSPDPWAAVPPTDADVLRQAVCASINDKEGFCAAVEHMIGPPPAPMGGLSQWKIERDTAVGRAKTTISHLTSGPGSGSQKVVEEVYVTVCFRNRGGKWLIESLSGSDGLGSGGR
jgi:hypothetical protein